LDKVLLAELVIQALWAAWALYWWVTSRRVKEARRREPGWSRIAHFGPLALAGILLALPVMPGGLGARFLPLSWVGYWIGIVIVAFGLGLCVRARIVLGTNWSASVTIKHDHEIVRSGPYRWTRHPIYTGLLLAFAGSAVARGEWRGVLAVGIAFAALWRKLRLEERWLTEEFGEQYANYQRSVAALIPFIL
jgi:protein-S-isoprenylcysteine O-methyltransferase Ste14